MEEAHEAGLSYGKYKACLELQGIEPAIRPDEIQGMTMREIRDLIDTLSGNSSVETGGSESSAHEMDHSENVKSGSGHEEHKGDGSGQGEKNRYRKNREE